jgi:hypothetical protein
MTTSELKNRLETILSHIENHAPDVATSIENLLLTLAGATQNAATDPPPWVMCAMNLPLNSAVHSLKSDPAPDWEFAAVKIKSALKAVTKAPATEG